jgi:phospholipid/cholesterol/gamma-HCH transport system permease protein
MLRQSLITLGQYFRLLGLVFQKPTKQRLFMRQIRDEIYYLGVNSTAIVAVISFFVGAAVTAQIKYNIDSPFMPDYALGFATRKAIILEFAPTIIGIILAGKIGSHIASQLGTMRISEQIDAIEAMGINSANYLILPKIIACFIFCPILIMLSIVTALVGGWTIGVNVAGLTTYQYIYGIQFEHNSFDLLYAIIKIVVFSFLISSMSSFYGYNVKGGALEVGRASTKAIVNSSIAIIVFNMVLTQLLIA